ncbi:bifunctional hydroxymethylpyrimidine kinase/phosphomethylpyrimidine kinase [Jeotgalibaca arthritidis]|uniref:Pyridoxamine kinase/Phosphomethylpyrimidine kinase domain-containing protein n=1 Tax=Jeotgalibaca arthritidis TaxID=1868794 RepID=A0A6G7KD37_9LACT|nr:bifunctional hydroxymethylpyrimidine kinase/phosphomethylpyrimidine kinase [Jeotgalibaca arthritidis]QII83170.1 hypothetical protein G7057_08000 [Jeotgalibaca arthritidis]
MKSDIETAAKKIQSLGAKNVFIKGGHRLDVADATAFLLLEDGSFEWLSKPRIDPQKIAGLAVISAITQAQELENAVRLLQKPFYLPPN